MDDASARHPSVAGSRSGDPLAFDADSLPSISGRTFSSLLDAGDMHAQVGDHGRALELFHAALALTVDLGERARVLRRIAYSLERTGKYRQVIDLLAGELAGPDAPLLSEADPTDAARAHVVLGKCYLEVGQLPAAREQAERALAVTRVDGRGSELSLEAGIAENLLGAVAFRTGDIEEAQTQFRRALERFRKLGDVLHLALSYLNLGQLFKQRGEWDRALEHFQAAYYLRATEGEYQDQGMIHLAVALVMMKVGRYEEAREQIDRSLKRAVELNDTPRVLRARLTLARWHRESGDPDRCRDELDACREICRDIEPEREGCQLLLEDAWLAHRLGDPSTARERVLAALPRIERMAAHGDLMIEALLLSAELDGVQGDWDGARATLARAEGMARADRDRYNEGRVLLAQLKRHGAAGEPAEAARIFRVLEERHRYGGERPALALLHDAMGTIEQVARGDSSAALEHFGRARDLWRAMGRGALEASLDLKVAETLLRLGQRTEAGRIVEATRERLGAEAARLHLAPAVERLLAWIRQEERASAGAALDGELALRRIEELLHWDSDALEKLRGAFRVMAEVIDAEGALLARVQGETLEVLASHAMARLHGKRHIRPADLGITLPLRASLLDPGKSAEEGSGISSSLVVPFTAASADLLLYLERRGSRAPFGRVDRDYLQVLAAEVSRGMPSGRTGSLDRAATPELVELQHGIWVADVITQDQRMLGILSLIHKVSDSDLTVLLQGETGTGKRLLAHAIHRISGRRGRPFVTVDCASLPDSILESELFGHRKGAFTGAIQDRIGLLEEADGGTVFLDEIDKAGLTVQRRFLHLLDSGEIRPVGATGYRTLDVRVVCATSSPDLRVEVAEGRFLKDLYYRLNDITVVVPPLRERPEDVALLAGCFIERFSAQLGRDVRGASSAFMERLKDHSWPGNVRELEKAIRRAVTLADPGSVLAPALLPPTVLEGAAERGARNGSLRERVESFEARALSETLDRLRWNKSRAAVELGLSRKGLKGKIERYGLDRRRRAARPDPGSNGIGAG